MAAFFDRIVRKRVIFWNEKHKKWPAFLLTTERYNLYVVGISLG